MSEIRTGDYIKVLRTSFEPHRNIIFRVRNKLNEYLILEGVDTIQYHIENVEKVNKFSIGDKVKIANLPGGYSSERYNDTFEIENIYFDVADTIRYDLKPFEKYENWFYKSWLEERLKKDEMEDIVIHAINEMSNGISLNGKIISKGGIPLTLGVDLADEYKIKVEGDFKDMNKLLEMYKDKKMKEIAETYKKLKEELYEKDEVRMILQDAENQLNVLHDLDEEKAIKLEVPAFFAFTEKTKKEDEKLSKMSKNEENELLRLVAEVQAHLEMADVEDYKLKIEILQNYGIVDKNGKIV